MKFIELIRPYRYLILMVFSILIILWPLSLFILTPKWDNVDAFLPYRYFISDYLWNGHFPFWNSFQQMGNPVYPDPQSGMWNPITWLIMLFGKYTMKALIIELLSYFILAGTGMYFLINTLFKHKKVSAIIGLSFALSGLMVGSTQLMVFLAGTAWLPWCVLALYKFLKDFKLEYAVLSGLFFALNVVSASPAYTIVLFYIYLVFFLHILWKNKQNTTHLKKICWGGLVLSLTVFILLLPYITSLIEFAPYFERISKLPYYGGHILINPFTPASYISFLFPYGVLSNSPIFDITSSTLRNAYIGILALIFFIYSLVYNYKNKKVIYGFIGVLFFLIVASGGQTFVYKILYYLPGFGTFAHPSFFRTYALFIMLVITGYGMVHFFQQQNKSNVTKKMILFLSIGILIIALISFFFTSGKEILAAYYELVNLTDFSSLSLSTHIVFNALVLLLIIGLVVLLKKWLRLSLFVSFFLFAFLDLGMQTMLTFPTTISYKIPYQNFSTFFKNLPNTIHQPSVDQPIQYFNDKNGLYFIPGIWENRSTFNKTISYEGYNPFRNRLFVDSYKDSSRYYNIKNPLFFFAKKSRQPNDSIQKGLVWGNMEFTNLQVEQTKIDTIHVGYNMFSSIVENQSDSFQWLLLNQNYYPKWKAFIGDEETPIYLLNTHIMGIKIPPNSKQKVSFRFNSPFILYFAGISIIGYILTILYCTKVFKFRKWKRKNKKT